MHQKPRRTPKSLSCVENAPFWNPKWKSFEQRLNIERTLAQEKLAQAKAEYIVDLQSEDEQHNFQMADLKDRMKQDCIHLERRHAAEMRDFREKRDHVYRDYQDQIDGQKQKFHNAQQFLRDESEKRDQAAQRRIRELETRIARLSQQYR